jgi:ABC-type Mn2+/Zn2+ transport system ATPase subunit
MSTARPVEALETAGAHALRIRGVTVEIDGYRVLEDVSLDVAAGEFVALLGPNGGGKTTLLKAILGLIEPRSGSIEVLGQSPERARSRVGYLPQRKSFNRSFPATAAELIVSARQGRWPLRLTERDRGLARTQLARVGGADLLEKQVAGLSGGETQRVFLARALANDPALLLLDEPTAGVDARGRADLLDLLAELSGRHVLSALIVTHNQAAVRRLAARAVCLDRRIVAAGCPDDVLREGVLEGRDLGLGRDHAEQAVCEED